MQCHCCGASLPPEAKVCASCGARLVCPHCETVLPWPPYYASGCEYCPHCGARIFGRTERVSLWNPVTVGCVIMLATPFAVFGACWVVLLISYNTPMPRSSNQQHGLTIPAVAILMGTVVLSILTMVAMEKLRKKKK